MQEVKDQITKKIESLLRNADSARLDAQQLSEEAEDKIKEAEILVGMATEYSRILKTYDKS